MTTLFLNAVHVMGADGECSHTTFDEWSDEIFICVKDPKGYNHEYYGDAKHLKDWCRHHKYQMRHQILEVEVENPFDLE